MYSYSTLKLDSFLYVLEIKRTDRKHIEHPMYAQELRSHDGTWSEQPVPIKVYVARNALVCTDYFLRMIHHRIRALQGRDGGSLLGVGRSHDIILPSQRAPVQFSSQLPSCHARFTRDIPHTSLHPLLPIIVSISFEYSFLLIRFLIGLGAYAAVNNMCLRLPTFIHAFIQSID